MTNWLSRLIGNRRETEQSASAQALHNYPVYCAPHAGPHESLNQAQTDANLAYLLQVKPERLQVLSEYMAEQGVDIQALFTSNSPNLALDSMHQWAGKQFPLWHSEPLARRTTWLTSQRAGEEVIYSFLMDISLALAEAIVIRRPQWAWVINRDATDIADNMISVNRPVLSIAASETSLPPFVLDIEMLAVDRFIHYNAPNNRLLNPWQHAVEDAAAGRYG